MRQSRYISVLSPVSEKTFGGDAPEVASSLLSVAEAQLLQGKFDEAEPLVKRALAINVSNNPPHKAAMNLNNLAVTYLNCGNAARGRTVAE